jgi:predicted RNA-binding Zn-ribbon protein involved in translation (DUF1610 family)
MNKIKCPKCNSNIEINVSKAVDEFGEVFLCKNCGYGFRYAPNG